MTDLRLSPRFADEVWKVEFDWTAALGDATITGQPTVAAVGSAFTVGTATTTANVTSFLVSDGLASGGVQDTTARIALLATLSSGEQIGFNIMAPIRAR